MSAAINKTKLNNFADDIWKSAERLRGKFKAYEYQNFIPRLPGRSPEPPRNFGQLCGQVD